jgi:uncharacterized protein
VIEANLVILNQHFQLPYIADLIAQKASGTEKAMLSQTDLAFHQDEYRRLMDVLKDISDRSHLPEAPSARAALDDLLVRVRMASVITQ